MGCNASKWKAEERTTTLHWRANNSSGLLIAFCRIRYYNHFVCLKQRRYLLQFHGMLQTRKLGQKLLSLLFLTPRPALSSHQHRTLIWKPTLSSLTRRSHYYSPRVLWAAGCIQQIKLLFLQHLVISGFPRSDHAVSKLSAGFTVKHSKTGLQTSSHPQNSDYHLLGLQGSQQ